MFRFLFRLHLDNGAPEFIYFGQNSNKTLRVYKSDSAAFNPATTQNAIYDKTVAIDAVVKEQGNVLTISFPVNALSNPPKYLYFSIVTSKKLSSDTSETGEIQDILIETLAILNAEKAFITSDKVIDNTNDFQLDGAADIISVEARTF